MNTAAAVKLMRDCGPISSRELQEMLGMESKKKAQTIMLGIRQSRKYITREVRDGKLVKVELLDVIEEESNTMRIAKYALGKGWVGSNIIKNKFPELTSHQINVCITCIKNGKPYKSYRKKEDGRVYLKVEEIMDSAKTSKPASKAGFKNTDYFNEYTNIPHWRLAIFGVKPGEATL